MTIIRILNEVYQKGLDMASMVYQDNKIPNAKKELRFLKEKEKEIMEIKENE